MGESDPEAAKPIIEKEFLFFIAADLEKLEEEFGAVPFNEVSELCLKRGASIDRDFNWKTDIILLLVAIDEVLSREIQKVWTIMETKIL